MNIYSFEFGTRPVKWFINEFRNMKFLGTTSRKFYGNMNFLRIPDEMDETSVKIMNGTFYKPAISLDGKYRIINHNETLNAQLIRTDNTTGTGHNMGIVFLTVDSDVYRLVDCNVAPLEDSIYPEIRRVAQSDKVRMAVIQFDMESPTEDSVALILYNIYAKKYEYHQIRKTGDRIVCENVTDLIDEEVMEEWRSYDKANGKENKLITPRFNYPVVKYFITRPEYRVELNDILNKCCADINYKRILVMNETDDLDKLMDMIGDWKVSALAWYNMDIPNQVKLKLSGIHYNFILDPTGLLM